jgi:hypothetical protein
MLKMDAEYLQYISSETGLTAAKILAASKQKSYHQIT